MPPSLKLRKKRYCCPVAVIAPPVAVWMAGSDDTTIILSAALWICAPLIGIIIAEIIACDTIHKHKHSKDGHGRVLGEVDTACPAYIQYEVAPKSTTGGTKLLRDDATAPPSYIASSTDAPLRTTSAL